MAYDTLNTYSTLSMIKDVVTGHTVDREGVLLVRTMEDGVEKVEKCSAAGALVPVGFAISDNSSDTTAEFVETVVFPTSAPYTVTLQHAPRAGSSAVLEEISLRNATTGVAMTQVDDATPNDVAKFDCTGTTLTAHSDMGLLTLAQRTHIATYRYTMSAVEAKMKYYERAINNQAGELLGQVTILTGQGQIFTHEYDAEQNWAAAPAIYTGADGVLSVAAGGGTDLSSFMRVISVPSSVNQALGVAFSLIP